MARWLSLSQGCLCKEGQLVPKGRDRPAPLQRLGAKLGGGGWGEAGH